MPFATKSAVAFGDNAGDVHTHIWRVNTEAVPKDSMWTDGFVRTTDVDGNMVASTTLDFVCLRCHVDQTVAWAAGFADEIHENGLTGVATDIHAVPTAYNLENNWPNPFNSNTNVRFTLPDKTNINLYVFDMLGKRIKTLADGVYNPGHYSVFWDGTDTHGNSLASGVYFYRLETAKFTTTKKMTFVK